MNKQERLLSLDALRGFDMLFIMGFSSLIIAICGLFPSGFSEGCASLMQHVPWDGLSHHDTIFPLFLFIAGISFPFSLSKQREKGMSSKEIYLKIIRRGLTLVVLGIIYNGLFNLDFDKLRYASVLGRIGLAWMFASIIFINFKIRPRIIIAASILIGYWLVSALIVAPDAPAGASPLSGEGCIAGYIDRLLLPGKLCYNGFDPEGLLSTVPSIVTAMLGMMTGEFVRLPDERFSKKKKAAYMALAALILIAIGILWNTILPINKKLWSSSFVCAVAGYSVGMFSLFYYIIDVKGYKKWTLFFNVIGLNSITIYMAQKIISFNGISHFFLGGIAGKTSELMAGVINNFGYVVICWLFLYFLYKKQIFLKI